MENTVFNRAFAELEGDELALHLIDTYEGNHGALPFYWWNIVLKSNHTVVGKISFRIGQNYHSYYNGNIGYEVEEAYRGHHYAYAACKLVLPVARYHGMEQIYLTCAHDNAASYHTIEKLGARLVEEVVPPKDWIYYDEGMEAYKIYELTL